MLIDKRVKAIAAWASRDVTRPAMCGVHVVPPNGAPGIVEATDGHGAFRVPLVCRVPDREFPSVVAMGDLPDGGVLVPTGILLEASKILPKPGDGVLTHARLGTGPQGGGIVVAFTDGERVAKLDSREVPETFPNVRNVVPGVEAAGAVQCFDPAYLKRVAETALAFGAGTVRVALNRDAIGPAMFTFRVDPEGCAGWCGQEAQCVVMPMRDDAETPKRADRTSRSPEPEPESEPESEEPGDEPAPEPEAPESEPTEEPEAPEPTPEARTSLRIVVRPSKVRPSNVEITFPGKPGEPERAELKAAGFRWSRFNGCWYGSAERLPGCYRAVA